MIRIIPGIIINPSRFLLRPHLHFASRTISRSSIDNEGNDTVRNGIVNVYLHTVSHFLDTHRAHKKWMEAYLPAELQKEYARQHYTSGI